MNPVAVGASYVYCCGVNALFEMGRQPVDTGNCCGHICHACPAASTQRHWIRSNCPSDDDGDFGDLIDPELLDVERN
jgi:hypothetical protein